MINVSSHPSITQLHELIKTTPRYPVSAAALVRRARRRKFPSEIVSFYESFPPDQTFSNREDLLARTELIELLQTQDPPLEDTVHGAED